MAEGIEEKFLIPPLARLHGGRENMQFLDYVKGYYM